MSISEKKEKCTKLKIKYPRKVPVICLPGQDLPDLDKQKFLVPGDLTLGEFTVIVRQRLKLNSKEALLMFSENEMLNASHEMDVIYSKCKDQETGFLYVTYSKENTFGSKKAISCF